MHAMEDQILDEKPRKRHQLVLFLIWLLFTLVVLALGYPRVRSSIEGSGVLEVLRTSISAPQTQANTRNVDVVFIQYPQTFQTFSVQQSRLGGSAYHDTFEALLAGPSLEVLKTGAVSYIHADTKLIGVTLSSSILYVDLSKEYLLSPDLETARQQIRRTALAFQRVKDVVILVEGKQLS
jgi:hypothetical protein